MSSSELTGSAMGLAAGLSWWPFHVQPREPVAARVPSFEFLWPLIQVLNEEESDR